MTELSGDIPEFGIKKDNEERRDGGAAVVFDPITQKYAVGWQSAGDNYNSEDGLFRLFSGGVDEGEDMKTGTLREVTEESGLYDFLYIEEIAQAFTHYYNSLRKVNRVALATCFLVVLRSSQTKETKLEAHEKFKLVWVSAEEILANWEARNQNQDYSHWIYFLKKSVERARSLGYDTASTLAIYYV